MNIHLLELEELEYWKIWRGYLENGVHPEFGVIEL